MPAVPISQIVALVEGRYGGDTSRAIAAVRPLAEAGENELTFLSGTKYQHLLEQTRASAVLVPESQSGDDPRFIRVRDPQLALAQILEKWFAEIPRPAVGVSSHAVVASTATLGDDARIGAHVVIGERVRIGRDVTVFDGCSIGVDSVIGDGSILYPNVTLYHRTVVGKRCILHSGVVLGSDGYGFVTAGGVHRKIPQVGIVRVEDDVEIGAGTTVDRATLGETVIGQGTKIDNLVQIGHNVKLGKHCLVVSQVGIAGSSELGDYVVLGGQSGVAGHLRIGSGVKIGSRAAVMKSFEGEETLSGAPARPVQEHLRSEALIRRLPELMERLEKLEQKIAEKKN